MRSPIAKPWSHRSPVLSSKTGPARPRTPRRRGVIKGRFDPVLTVAAALAFVSLAAAQAPGTPADAKGNIAPLAKAVASSSRPEFPVKQVNDGDRTTSWSVKIGAKAGEWLRFDWPSTQKVAGVVLYPTGPFLASFDVEAATPAGWKKLAHAGSPGLARLRRIVLPVTPATTRALRLANLAPTADGGPALFEVEIYGDREPLDRMAREVDIALSGDSRGRI